MSKKLEKGYFVRGEFVAEGSVLDQEFKAQLKGTDAQSRTDLKRESTQLQKLGCDLLTLRADVWERLALSDPLKDALHTAKRITNFEGKRRQLQLIGKLMRLQDSETIHAIKDALDQQAHGSASEKLALHQAEVWRDRLMACDAAVSEWIAQHPGTDTQQLRALIRQARKDALPQEPGTAAHHSRAYRALFQEVRRATGAS